MIALIVFAAWIVVSVFVLALCAAAGGADRALELMVPPAPPEAACDFVAGFAEPAAEPAGVSRPALPTRT